MVSPNLNKCSPDSHSRLFWPTDNRTVFSESSEFLFCSLPAKKLTKPFASNYTPSFVQFQFFFEERLNRIFQNFFPVFSSAFLFFSFLVKRRPVSVMESLFLNILIFSTAVKSEKIPSLSAFEVDITKILQEHSRKPYTQILQLFQKLRCTVQKGRLVNCGRKIIRRLYSQALYAAHQRKRTN